MFNFGLLEYEMMEAIRRSRQPETAVEAFLAQLAEERRASGLRRRFAGLAMRLALKLDPEAVAPRLQTLEVANVRG
jgi:hypothetical protein